MNDKVTCAQRIRQGLEMRGMTQKDLCEKTGIPKSAMSQYCNGAFVPKQNRVALIAKALHVSEAWLMGYNVPENPHALYFKCKSWKSDKKARLYMCIDSNLLDYIETFAGEDGLSLEDEVEQILYWEMERRIDEYENERIAMEMARLPPDALYPSQRRTTSTVSTDSSESEQP